MTKKISILIVDDDESTRRTMRLIFEAHGYEIETAGSGQEALAKANQRFFNVALLDIKLPDMEGVELLAPLQQQQPDLAAIMVTAYASVDTAVRALNQGAAAYINKPLNMQELQAVLRQVLDKQRLIVENRRLLAAVQQELAERSRVEAEIRRRNQELSLLNQVIAASVAGLEPEAILQTACRELARAFNLSHTLAALWDKDKKAVTVVAEYRTAERPTVLNMVIPLPRNPDFQQMFLTRAPLAVNDTQRDPRLAPLAELLQQYGVVSLLFLPLSIAGEVMGGLSLSTTEPRSFSAEEISLAGSVADEIAGALGRAHLVATQQRLFTAIEQTTESIVITDVAGQIIYVNPAFERVSGYSQTEAVGQNPRILKSRKQDQPVYEQLWATITAGQTWHSRLINKRKDGALFTEDVTITPIRDQNGVIVNYVAVKRDVTRELQLEEQYHQVIASISDHIYVTEVTAANQYINRYLSPNVEDLTGYPYQNFVEDWSFWPQRVIHPGDQARAAQQAGRLRLGQNSEVEYRLIRADGQIIWVRDSGQVKASNDSKFIYGVVSDITARKRAEEEIKSRVRQHAVLAELGRLALTGSDLSTLMDQAVKLLARTFGVEYCKILECLPNRKTMLLRASVGWQEGAVGQTTLAVGSSDSQAGYTLLAGQPVVVEDFSQETRFKLPRWLVEHQVVSGMSVVIQGQAQPIGVLAVHTSKRRNFSSDDVNFLQAAANLLAIAVEQKWAETALKEEQASLARRVAERTTELSAANAELARATRLKDEFLANMSHELRTPLNAILGMSEVLTLGVYGKLNQDQLKAVGHISEGGTHLLELINDILDISKIEAGKLKLEVGPVVVGDICQASLRLVNQMAQQKHIKAALTLAHTLPTVQADERRLKQILVNLLNNAVKFTPEGGQIGLEVNNNAAQESIHFTVWDTGIGIAPAELKQLFQPFVQIDSSLSRRHEGTGLGLSLVLRLAEMHGGGVAVSSEVGQGSRFTVSLPVLQQQPAPPTPTPEPTPEISQIVTARTVTGDIPPLILLAEDNETNIITVKDFLEASGYRVVVARNGAEAVVQARTERPRLILMDIQMPGMDGLEATRHIRAEAELATTPIIALTALAMPGDRERCLEAGANDYLSKPVSLGKLLRILETQLQHNA